MKTVATIDYVVIAAYMALMVGIGVYAARFNKNASDYFRGANRIPWLVAGLSSFMSGFSAWTFTGAAGLAYVERAHHWPTLTRELVAEYELARALARGTDTAPR